MKTLSAPRETPRSLEAYLRRVSWLPSLDAEEEQALARRVREFDDPDAAQRLALAHLRFVVYIARHYTGYGLALADLIQEGNVGLLEAIQRFDPERGVRLVTFAAHWIRSQIQEFILRNWRIVRVATTKAQRKLFFNLRSARPRLGWLHSEEAAAMAQELGVSTEEVLEMESRLSGHDVPFDLEPGDEDDYTAPITYLAAEDTDPLAHLEQSDWEYWAGGCLEQAIAGLHPRSRDILRRRRLEEDKSTLQELAAEHGLTAERIRQLEGDALRQLRARMAVSCPAH